MSFAEKIQPAELCRRMILIRYVEQSLLRLYAQGLMGGTVHTCIGQEGCAVGVVSAIDRQRDMLFSNHRGHGHYLAYCGDIHGLIAEIMGLPIGVCGGMGGSQHIQRENFYTNGIQGAGVPIAVGMGLAERFKGTGAVSLAFLGDGTFGEGAVYEAMNLAALWSAPTLFVVEHNGYAQSTPSSLQHAGDLSRRAEPFGIPVTRTEGADVIAVFEVANRLLGQIRAGKGPRLLFLDTHRFAPHSKGDDFRDREELERINRECDPIQRLAAQIGADTYEQVRKAAEIEVDIVLQELGVQ
ncbi:thiamine pyrophosphate-dependent dehydrogenase E1 component subunit alpha [Halochromatium salexigens]|uniref:Pyruvate dehydrogenase n=1 Tax=Halochromatium salexigens TaxID=49447 RepID=A0AAJ0UEN7_HALSE|nr:thiamine pyrophosphate-dependent dehydrogenase E1 component subunit alpha [Halochromatium salexigens]MBK5929946.1 pyruvate dehydrogenase [Halochromatium salexigens]